MLIIFCNFFMVKQVFLSPQVKRNVIISNKLIYTWCLISYGMNEDVSHSGLFQINTRLCFKYLENDCRPFSIT